MSRNKKKKLIFHSMIEFEKVFLPKSFRKRMSEKPTDAYDLGIYLAKESLNKIRQRLTG
jgi:hypothetical protein